MKLLRYLSIVSLVIILASCESKTFLRSKKKLNSDLKGHWRPISGTSKYGTAVYNQNIQWVFEDGEVKIVKVVDVNNPDKDIILDKGLYSVSTKIDNCFLSISDFKSRDYDTTFGFGIKWNIIQLSGTVLDIAGRPNNILLPNGERAAGGMVELEFEKKN